MKAIFCLSASIKINCSKYIKKTTILIIGQKNTILSIRKYLIMYKMSFTKFSLFFITSFLTEHQSLNLLTDSPLDKIAVFDQISSSVDALMN